MASGEDQLEPPPVSTPGAAWDGDGCGQARPGPLPGHDRQYPKTSRTDEEGSPIKRYAVVIEKTGDGYGAHVPDLPGCVAAGDTYEQTQQLIREAIPFHLEGLRQNGDAVPDPATRIEFVDVEPVA